jgi:multisubunit Na+/H+ antiporter MnhB subunit
MIRGSILLDTVIDLVARAVLVFALFLLLSGHNAPGGGFVGGLVAGSALLLRFLASGAEEVEGRVTPSPEALMSTGLALAALTGGWSWLAGEPFLSNSFLNVELPLLGTVKTTSALPFDVGVFLVVFGACLAIVISLGRERLT